MYPSILLSIYLPIYLSTCWSSKSIQLFVCPCILLSVHLPIYLSTCLSTKSIQLSVYPSILLSVHLPIYLCTCLSTKSIQLFVIPSILLSVHLPIYLSTWTSIQLFVYPSILLSIHLPIYLSTCLSTKSIQLSFCWIVQYKTMHLPKKTAFSHTHTTPHNTKLDHVAGSILLINCPKYVISSQTVASFAEGVFLFPTIPLTPPSPPPPLFPTLPSPLPSPPFVYLIFTNLRT